MREGVGFRLQLMPFGVVPEAPWHTDPRDARAEQEESARDSDKLVEVYIAESVRPNGREGDKDAGLIILLHDFAETPHMWRPFIARLKTILERRSPVLAAGGGGWLSWRFWALALPNMGAARAALPSCHFKPVSRLLANFLIRQKKANPGRPLYLVGRGLGGLLGWYVQQSLGEYHDHVARHGAGGGAHAPKKVVDGYISFSPHLLAYMQFYAQLPYHRFYARFMTDPAFSRIYMAADDFAFLRGIYENATWWTRDWQHDFRHFWRRIGAQRLTCYYQDNVRVDAESGRVAFRGVERSARVTTHGHHVLLLGHARDRVLPPAQYQHSISLLSESVQRGQVLDYHQLSGDYLDFLEREGLEEAAREVARFLRRLETLPHSLWGYVMQPVHVQHARAIAEPASAARGVEDARFPVALTLAICMALVGVAAEAALGAVWLGWRGRRDRERAYIFVKMLAPLVFSAAVLTASPAVLAPLAVFAVHDLGFPTITAQLAAALRAANRIHADDPGGGDRAGAPTVLEVVGKCPSRDTPPSADSPTAFAAPTAMPATPSTSSSPSTLVLITPKFESVARDGAQKGWHAQRGTRGKQQDPQDEKHQHEDADADVEVLASGGLPLRIRCVLDAVGMLVHHFGGFLLLATCCVHEVNKVAIYVCGLPLLGQHLCTGLRLLPSWMLPLEIVASVGLDVWFFFAVRHFSHFSTPRIQASLMMVVVSHAYMYVG